MGVCYLQHRTVTGLFANKTKQSLQSSSIRRLEDKDAQDINTRMGEGIRSLTYSLILTLYILLLITIVTVANVLPMSKGDQDVTKDINFISLSSTGVHFGTRQLTSCWVLVIIAYLSRSMKTTFFPVVDKEMILISFVIS